MLKKSLIAAAVLSSISGMALADVTVYGRIDTGVYVKKTEKLDAGKTTKTDSVSMASGSKSGSRWGLKGKEDLGNGYKIGFVLESGFDSDTGERADNTKIFNRDSYLELTGPMGGFKLVEQAL